MKKLYCYVDESGQDSGSKHFIVVAVINAGEQDIARKKLDNIENESKTNKLKWHKTNHKRRMRYLNLVLEQNIASGNVYSASYKKPIPFFFPLIDVTEKAIKKTAKHPYTAMVYVDGIDKLKAKALTNALRLSGVSLRLVKSRRDESEPLIRLADMWAGCLRSALLKHKDAQAIVRRAKKERYLVDLSS